MEGLLPLVYRTIKKSRTRRHYECLSSGAAQSYHVSDFYVNDYSKQQQYGNYGMQMTAPPETKIDHHGSSAVEGMAHRRRNSIHVDYLGRFSPDDRAANSRKLVRFRSHRFFSCVTGV